MAAIQIKNGTTDISSSIDWRSLDIVSVVTKEKGSAKFDILNINSPQIPNLGDTINIYYNSTLIWAGTCTEKEIVIDGGILQRYKITCMDWGFKLDSMVVHKTYQNMDPADIVTDLISNFSSGFTTAHVQRGNFLVASIKFNYEPVTKCLESLAKLIGWDWYVDPNKDVHFFFATTNTGSSELNPAPFNIDDTSGDILWPTLDVDMSIANLKNSIYVIGGTMFRANTSGNTPDVYTTVAGQVTYYLTFPYDTTTLGTTLKVTLDGVVQSVGIDGQASPASVNCLYGQGAGGGAQGGAPYIKFTSDPGAGHTLKIFGNATLPIVAHLTNPTSITTYGEYQDTIIDKQIKSVQEAQARADAELIQFDHPVYDVKFSTLVSGLSIGQTITLNSIKLGITNYQLLIRRVEATCYTPDPSNTTKALLFQVEALGSDNVTFNDIMMTLLQDSLAQNVTPDNSILQEVIPINEELDVLDSIAVTSGTLPYKWGPGSPQPAWNFFKWS
ncbi:MAG TPA: hypothetical protein VKW08_00380 [Xanthobacteraceae bacterium]|nr:hypothetical protein [Xanthobacteraceae bacterium]